MPNVIKLASKTKTLNVKFKEFVETEEVSYETQEEDYLQHQLQDHYDEGYIAGRDAAKLELEEQYVATMRQGLGNVKTIITQINNQLIEYEKAYTNAVMSAAVAIGEKIIKREIENKSIIVEVLKEALQKVIGANTITIRLNSNDYTLVKEFAGEIFKDESLSKAKFEVDGNVEPGGCFIETEIGNIDARTSTQFAELKKVLEKHFVSGN